MQKPSSQNIRKHNRLTLGVKDDIVFHISEVDSGLKCGVNCASCGDKLVAKKGKTFHHFAHYRIDNCTNGGETAIHLLSKEILAEELRIMLPKVELKVGGKEEPYVFYSEQEIKFSQVKLETKVQDIVPDIIGYVGQEPLLIEIAVTHFVEAEKQNKIEQLNISTIEIDLSEFKQGLTKPELKEILIHQTSKKRWIYNKKLKSIKQEIDKEQKRLIEEYDFEGMVVTRRWHMKCPISRNGFASYFDNCWYCLYKTKFIDDHILGGKLSVICSAKNSERITRRIKELGGMPISNK